MRGFVFAGGADGFSEADIDSARSIDEISIVMFDMAARFKFREYSIYADLPDDKRNVQPLRVISSMPNSFHSGLDAITLNSGDDFLVRAWRGSGPSYWDIDTLRAIPDKIYADALEKHFLRYQVQCGIRIPLVTQRGLLRVIAFSGNREPMTPEEIESLHYLTIILINRFEEIETEVWNRDGADSLNQLELKFLQAFANGLDSDILARKFHLSEPTACFVLDSARRKLGSISLTHAVADAMRRGLIQ